MIKEAVFTFCAEARARSIVLVIEPLLSIHLTPPDASEFVNDKGGDNSTTTGGGGGGGGSIDTGSSGGNIIVSPLLVRDTVAIDKSKIVQAIRNLVANAIKYSSPGSIVTIRAGKYCEYCVVMNCDCSTASSNILLISNFLIITSHPTHFHPPLRYYQ